MLLENPVNAFGVTAVETVEDGEDRGSGRLEGFEYRVTLRNLRTEAEQLISFTAVSDSFALFCDLLNRERVRLGLVGAAWVIADQQSRDLAECIGF